MSNEQFEDLKKRVIEFVKSQEGYDETEHEKLRAFCENKNTFAVTYGDNIVEGIAGFGETPDLAFEDFVRSWNELNGFEWLRNNKNRFGR
jgi:L-arabinose isomerase